MRQDDFWTLPTEEHGEAWKKMPPLRKAALAAEAMGWEIIEVGYFGTDKETPRMRELSQWMDEVGLCAVGLYAIDVEGKRFKAFRTGQAIWDPAVDMGDAYGLRQWMRERPDLWGAFIEALKEQAEDAIPEPGIGYVPLWWFALISDMPDAIAYAVVRAVYQTEVGP